MPLFTYKCQGCGLVDQRVGGLDDNVAICLKCGGLMFRIEDWPEVFEAMAREET